MRFILTSVSVGMVVTSFLVNNVTKIVKLSQSVNNEVQVLSAQAYVQTTPVPTVAPQPVNEFYFPGSKIIEQTDGKIVMEAGSDPDSVTNWYRDLLASYDMPINSTIRTETNGKVGNKLVSTSGPRKIEVAVTKYPDSKIVFINVSY